MTDVEYKWEFGPYRASYGVSFAMISFFFRTLTALFRLHTVHSFMWRSHSGTRWRHDRDTFTALLVISFKKTNLKMLSAKWWPFYLCPNVFRLQNIPLLLWWNTTFIQKALQTIYHVNTADSTTEKNDYATKLHFSDWAISENNWQKTTGTSMSK